MLGACVLALSGAPFPATAGTPPADSGGPVLPLRHPASVEVQQLGRWEGQTFRWEPVATNGCRPMGFDIAIPAAHRFFTVVIDAAPTGRRVRNLLAMADASAYAVATNGAAQTLALTWNGCDDDGQPVPVGDYRVRGLSHPGLKPEFEYAWYNPGDPPWEGYRTDGFWSGWGGDHSGQSGLACPPAEARSPWRVLIAQECGEAGDSIFALDAECRKVFGYKRGWWGSRRVAYGDGAFWFADAETWSIRRLAADGSGKLVKFQRPAGAVAEIRMDSPVNDLAVGPEFLAVTLDPNPKDLARFPSARLMLLDKTAGRILNAHAISEPAFVAFDAAGRLLLSATSGVVRMAMDGTREPVELPGVSTPGALAFDAAGRLHVMDMGTDSLVKVFDAELKPSGAVGRAGGQRGVAFDREALHAVSDIAIDAQGCLWVAENTEPRRVVVFGPDGAFQRDFVGNTHYGASACTLHEQDPHVATAYGVLYAVDPARVQTYAPTHYLWDRHRTGGEWLAKPVVMSGFERPQLLRSAVSGAPREYLVDMHPFPVLHVKRGDAYRPVAAIGRYEQNYAFASPGGNPRATILWSDRNGDADMQGEEMQTVSAEPVAQTWFYGWTHLLSTNLAFYVGGYEIAPTGFDADGAPRYDVAAARKLASPHSFVRVGDRLVGTENADPLVIGKYLFADLDGRVLATYPINWTGVHGSMPGPLPMPGQTCGELFWSGTADGGPELGGLIASHGNMGQAFLFTTDGLFFSSLFKDFRDQPAGPGPKVVVGADWTDVTMSQESFGGWFGRQEDGKYRYLFGRNAAQVVTVSGIEEARRFEAGVLRVAGDAP